MNPGSPIDGNELSCIWLLIGEQRIDQQSLKALLSELAPSSLTYLAVKDEHSERAHQWTRDPLGLLPSGRIAITNTHSLSDALIEAINALTGTTPYHCSTRTPRRLPLDCGERYSGTLQLCCFRRLEGVNDAQLASAWLGDHTSIALNTQSTEGYRQHWVNAHPGLSFDGIVEEYFPAAAALSVEHFFNAVGDRGKLKQHIEAMTASTSQFLDLHQSQVIHLSDSRVN